MPCKADAGSASWVYEDADLAAVTADWGSVIGLDTEFQRTDTFFPLPGLYQVSARAGVWFLDPLTLEDLSPFMDVLEDRRVTKVMHACSEDLELLRHHFGAAPVGLFDTQVANAFLSPDASLSFTRLVEALLGVTLAQSETRSDWRARPLSPAQERYAWEDVHYLLPLHELLAERLERSGRRAWFEEEMAQRGRFVPADPDRYYLSIRRAARMDGLSRARLRALCAWRERAAMALDRPRNRVLRDDVLVELAQASTLDGALLARTLPPGAVRRFGDELVRAHRSAADDEHPPAPERPLGSIAQGAANALREVALQRSESLGMAPELLGRRRDIEACVRHFAAHGELAPIYRGWREALVGDDFRSRLSRTTGLARDFDGGRL